MSPIPHRQFFANKDDSVLSNNHRRNDADNSKKIAHSAVLWNAVGGTLFAVQNLIILIAIAHICGIEAAGIFTIAYTLGNLFLYIGNYGMRQFEASDCANQYSFPIYKKSRFVTCICMIGVFSAYVLIVGSINHYSAEKNIVILLVCCLKVIDAYEDVYHGEYQREGRLDIAAKALSLRIFTTIILIISIIIVTHSITISIMISVIYSAAFLVIEIIYIKQRFDLPHVQTIKSDSMKDLLKKCFPLFIAAFLLFYLGNAPRYAIDATMDDSANAYFGYIMMPNFVIALLMSFIFNPQVTPMANLLKQGRVDAFMKRIGALSLIILFATICVAGACWLIGIPILNFIFNAELSHYRVDLLILVLGGGLLALVSLLTLALTIIRFQKVLLPLYIFASCITLPASYFAVIWWGIEGASITYALTMLMLATLILACFIFGIKSNTNSRQQKESAT